MLYENGEKKQNMLWSFPLPEKLLHLQSFTFLIDIFPIWLPAAWLPALRTMTRTRLATPTVRPLCAGSEVWSTCQTRGTHTNPIQESLAPTPSPGGARCGGSIYWLTLAQSSIFWPCLAHFTKQPWLTHHSQHQGGSSICNLNLPILIPKMTIPLLSYPIEHLQFKHLLLSFFGFHSKNLTFHIVLNRLRKYSQKYGILLKKSICNLGSYFLVARK